MPINCRRKFSLIYFIILFPSVIQAETKQYAGFSNDQNYTKFDNEILSSKNAATNSNGFGVKYGVVMPIQKQFLFLPHFFAPEISFDYLDAKTKDGDKDPIMFDYKYGVKANFGCNINTNNALLFSLGIEAINYELQWRSVRQSTSGTGAGGLLGVGLIHNLSARTSLDFNYHSIYATSQGPAFKSNNNADYEVNIHSFKVGTSYKF